MTKDKKVRELLSRMVEKIKRHYQPEKIILFGSYAWGNPTKDSDIDLFIIKDTEERHMDRAVRVREIIYEENRLVPLEVLVYTPVEVRQRLKLGDDFIGKIIEEGQVLHG